MAAQFPYESTHSLREHQVYWHPSKVIKKPSPAELAQNLAKLAEFDATTTGGSLDESASIAIHDAWRASLYMAKQLCVRNELGLWDCANESPNRVCLFVDCIDMLSPARQLEMCTGVCQSEEEDAKELCQNFFLLGHLRNEGLSCLVLHFAHIDRRSISIKILRSLFEVLKRAGIGKVILSGASVVRRVIVTSLHLEYKTIEFEFWSEEEVLFDWFGSHINNPMVVCRQTHCMHESPTQQEACTQCSKNQRSILGNLYFTKYALPFVLPQCMIARRFAMKEGDVLDSARPTGRFLRHHADSLFDRNGTVEGGDDTQM